MNTFEAFCLGILLIPGQTLIFYYFALWLGLVALSCCNILLLWSLEGPSIPLGRWWQQPHYTILFCSSKFFHFWWHKHRIKIGCAMGANRSYVCDVWQGPEVRTWVQILAKVDRHTDYCSQADRHDSWVVSKHVSQMQHAGLGIRSLVFHANHSFLVNETAK